MKLPQNQKYGIMKNEEFKMILKIHGLDDLEMSMNNYVKKNDVAISSSINRVMVTARKVSLDHVSKVQGWNMKPTKFKALSHTKNSTVATLHGQFIMDSKSIPLLDFTGTAYRPKLTPKFNKRKGGGSVFFKIKKQNGFKPLSKSFVMPSKFGSHKDTAFVRRKSPRGADITAQHTITPSSMFQQEGEDKFINSFMNNFEARYYNQLKYYKIL